MKKADLNPNIYLQEGNSVLVDDENYGFLIFSLPARETCPFATDMCKKICYGRNAQESFKHVYNCRTRNYKETIKETFVADMIENITYQLSRKKYKTKTILFRIHETGDFYNQEYFDKWKQIADYFKNDNRIIFQAYTKSLAYLKKYNISDINIKIMFSILPDTDPFDIEVAKSLKLNTFSAVPIEWFEKVEPSKQCKGNCSVCKCCYVGTADMYVEFHGNRAPRKRGRLDYEKSLYWSWKEKH